MQYFIEENIDLIENDKWEEIYQKLDREYKGELTQIMLEARIDPAEKLGYILEAYLNDSEIKEYVVPDSVTSIDNYAFWNYSSLISVYYKGTESDWGKISIHTTGNENLTNATRYYQS